MLLNHRVSICTFKYERKCKKNSDNIKTIPYGKLMKPRGNKKNHEYNPNKTFLTNSSKRFFETNYNKKQVIL